MLLTTTIYAKSVPGEFLWDDDDHIHANAAVQAPGGLRAIWLAPGSSLNYFPLTTTAFWAQVRLWGNWAPGFRAVNLVIHVVNSILVWRMLERISVRGAYLTGLVFAVHPVQVQTVAWITELKNLLGFLLYLLAMAAWWRFDPPAEPRGVAGVPTTQRAGEGWHRWGRYGLALVLFVGATLAKANMVVWIGGVALVRYLKQGPLQRRDFMLLGPFLVAGLGVAAFSVFFERAINRSVGADWSATPLERILIAGHALWHYAGTLLWPARLAFFYPRWRPDIHNVLDYLPAAAAVATPVACWRLVPTFGRGSLVGVLWFGGTILPALGLVNIYGHRYSQVY
ncbi:MAG: hypothetical protein EBX36_09640, partial [Planctomycetia bacterium]|nr:hypothetical protein [Planctomycetia bacterium]